MLPAPMAQFAENDFHMRHSDFSSFRPSEFNEISVETTITTFIIALNIRSQL